ncbi:PREDICTED: GDSL esterase/lipase At3g14220 [Tarenaya hassleriana]|uniref:GDSL esterase/lipase At3g14220 n=1 Tax=Tarenaya hassleriana TaxID=28532 RepID=UPI00053C7AAD|nr:PREDICTED: GDSL esterase/lipase At3g14220 [Tarenaya hassleriana]
MVRVEKAEETTELHHHPISVAMAVNRNLVAVVGLFLAFTLFSLPAEISGEQTLLFTFGDSSYDVGNKKFFSSEFDPAAAWPYGDSVDDPTGRWSDGLIVPDFVGKMIGIGEPVPPVLDPKADLSRGASFAIAGATARGVPSDTMSFPQQVSKFMELKGRWTDKQRAEALYMFYVGADDYLKFAKENPSASQADRYVCIASVLTKISSSLYDLHKKGGARKIAVQNLPPLGCLPIVRQEFKTGEECLEILNFMASVHNERLKRLLGQITIPLRNLRYSLLDFHSEILRRINDPSRHGYTDTTTSCCGIGPRNAFGCGYSNVHSNLCSYQRSFLFYDGRHNTEKTNREIADLFYSGDKNVVVPRNIRDLMREPATDLLQES